MSTPIDVDELVGRDEWGTTNRLGRPFVVYKFAATLDGRIAAADGTSQWITSAASRAEVHLLRAGCDATLIGSGTQRADNPNLAVRGNDDPRLNLSMIEPTNQPFRVVVDTRGNTPTDANVLNDAAPTLVAVADDANVSHLDDADLLRVPRSEQGLDLPALLKALFERGVRGIFLEGGPTLAGSFIAAGLIDFIAAGLIDRVINYIAPALLGDGKAGLQGAGITTMSEILRLDVIRLDHSGPDVRIIARPRT